MLQLVPRTRRAPHSQPWQAVEAIKILSGVGEPMSRRLLLLDTLSARFHVVKLRARCAPCAVRAVLRGGAAPGALAGCRTAGGDMTLPGKHVCMVLIRMAGKEGFQQRATLLPLPLPRIEQVARVCGLRRQPHHHH